MKRLLVFIFSMMLVLGLSACKEEALELPKFSKDDAVELTAQEMVQLFENIDYSAVDSESFKMQTEGYVKYKEIDAFTNKATNELSMTIDLMAYGVMGSAIEDVKLLVEGNMDLSVFQQEYGYESLSYENFKVKGSMGAYFVDGYFYLKADGSYQEDDQLKKEAVFKEKYSQQVTQTMWDEMILSNVDPDAVSGMIPNEYLQMLESADLQALMDVIPNLKVYKDGNKYSIVFSINKTQATDSMTEVIAYYYELLGYEMSEEQVQFMATEMKAEIDEIVKELDFTYVISIENNRVVQMAEKLIFKSVDGLIDINLLNVMSMGTQAPKFPTDLDTYKVVDELGTDFTETTEKQ
ncbi:MAG: hypothetical protein RBQ91_05050 [Acholeplasma sp.]|nr:hypothetical protein [Acholeplasma sp.]